MTPRQLAAHARLRHWQKEEELAALAEVMRMAEHAKPEDFTKMIKRLRG
jgi:mRNA-degrading endonuclease HigB of HigAB toxin-antitoxin module